MKVIEADGEPLKNNQFIELTTEDHQVLLLDVGQNLKFILFPFLLWILPLKAYKVNDKANLEKAHDYLWLAAIIGGLMTDHSSMVDKLISGFSIKINLFWSIVLVVIIAIIVRFCLIKHPSPKTGQEVYIKLRPFDITNVGRIFAVFIGDCFLIFMTIGLLTYSPGNIFYESYGIITIYSLMTINSQFGDGCFYIYFIKKNSIN